MERAAVQAAVESARHRPALYWGVVSAAALWGTLALAKRSTSERRRKRSAAAASPSVHAFKRLRRQYAENLRPLLEDLVYLAMFLLNLLVGLFYWILDSALESRLASSPQTIAMSSILSPSADSSPLLESRPRRGQIKRLRTRWAWARSKPNPNPLHRCDCWGWNLKDLSPDNNHSEVQTKKDGDEGNAILPRWSDCHCDLCAPLLMPMRVAVERLHVISEESFRATREGGVGSASSNLAGEEEEEGTAVIFIHGLFSSATFWFDTDIALNLSGDLKEKHRILAPDLLGCGRSPRPVDGLYTLADHVEAIEKSVIQRYKLRSFHLVGHSMGSIVALALAARCPERVRSISLVAPVYPPCGLREDGELAQIPCDAFFSSLDPLTVKGVRALTVCKYYNISRLIAQLFYAKHTFWVGRVHGLLKSKGYPRSFIHDYLTVYHDAAWHIAHNTLLAGTHAVIPALKKLRDSGHQILVIHGEIDTTIRFRLAEEMSRTFSNVELVRVPEKGHVDVVWGRAKENALLIEKAIREGDNRWSGS